MLNTVAHARADAANLRSEIRISEAEFMQFRKLMKRIAGVDMPASKMHMVSGRLARRLREHGLKRFDDYYRLVTHEDAGDELHRMVDLLTTHETFFFREPAHFAYLREHAPRQMKPGAGFRVWSAASSTGEEAYSVAMTLMDRLGPDSNWDVFASDISREVLDKARTGIYAMNRIDGIPQEYLRRYCLRGTGHREGTLRVAREVRERVRFAQVNLNESLTGTGSFDVIFLRNVLIYFDLAAKQQIVRRIVGQLKPHGLLFIGHSETLNGVTAELRAERPTVYRKV